MHKLQLLRNKLLIFLFVGSVFLIKPDNVSAAIMSLTPSNQAVTLNTPFTVNITLDTKGVATTAVDILLTFNPAILEISNVQFGNPPLYPVNTKILDNTNGQIRITSTQENAVNSYTGTGTLATLTITGKSLGTGNVTFTCNAGQTNETNIFQTGTNQDITECGNLVNGVYTIGTAAQPASTATSTPVPTLPKSGNIGPTGLFVVGGAVLLGIGALVVFLL
ncbi:hypothetical protein HYT02_00150 [Candidatus Gottesmanbacteria bacterium]|nr:hypothetical protein [Candidatus Gottesmanbacteria bacterium]